MMLAESIDIKEELLVSIKKSNWEVASFYENKNELQKKKKCKIAVLRLIQNTMIIGSNVEQQMTRANARIYLSKSISRTIA